LDKTINERNEYAQKKKTEINGLEKEKESLISLDDLYTLNKELIYHYEGFINDSLKKYILENIRISEELGRDDYFYESSILLANACSSSGSLQLADSILNSLNNDSIPDSLKIPFNDSCIKYYDNFLRYADGYELSQEYTLKKRRCVDELMKLIDRSSNDFLIISAFQLIIHGNYNDGIDQLKDLLTKQTAGTKLHREVAINLARACELNDNNDIAKKYYIIASIDDIRLVNNEKDALLLLTKILYNEGDFHRANTYLQIFLENNFSASTNLNMKNISNLIMEDNANLYGYKEKNKSLTCFLILSIVVFFFLLLGIWGVGNRWISRKMKTLYQENEKLQNETVDLTDRNDQLYFSNLMREKYIGIFVQQSALFMNKFDEYRKNINRKVKAGQIDDLLRFSSRSFDKESDEFYANFDKAFLKLFPTFIEEFNSLLKPEERFEPENNQLNTELRIYALIRLGITETDQIALFLGYSVQTIYNYKHKIRAKALIDPNNLEEEVRKIAISY